MKETGQDSQAVVEDLLVSLEDSADAFDQAAESLLDGVKIDDPHTVRNVDEYVRGLNTIITGSLYGQLAADRYDIAKYLQENNSMIIPL
ncbi:hypothetical protein QBC43DRAFT_291383 [Cladorrhinum sp. PSN259]|nr:hypothetical protein QBC43DRAFT_291383 [Cladorrhinum sp. PSN259]